MRVRIDLSHYEAMQLVDACIGRVDRIDELQPLLVDRPSLLRSYQHTREALTRIVQMVGDQENWVREG